MQSGLTLTIQPHEVSMDHSADEDLLWRRAFADSSGLFDHLSFGQNEETFATPLADATAQWSSKPNFDGSVVSPSANSPMSTTTLQSPTTSMSAAPLAEGCATPTASAFRRLATNPAALGTERLLPLAIGSNVQVSVEVDCGMSVID